MIKNPQQVSVETAPPGIRKPVWKIAWVDAEDRFPIDFSDDEGLTMQAPAEEQDINVIMRRFGIKDGSQLPRWTDPQAIYGDFSNMPNDPVEAAEIIRRGEVSFNTLPADVRNRFGSGAKLYNWLQDEKNTDEAIRLGLMAEKPRSVSSSTSSDKESLVPSTPNPQEGE